MASGQAVYKGALGWNDWVWWVAIGSVALLILLLLVCCCVCMQRARRKGHEEALAAVQTHQRTTLQREQENYHEARELPLVTNHAPPNGYHPPAYTYSTQPVTAIPLPTRKTRVAANGSQENPPHLHTQQIAKPYPPLPGQHEGQATGQVPGRRDRYPAPPNWYNASAPSGYDASEYPDGIPFTSVTSPSASTNVKGHRRQDRRLPNEALATTKPMPNTYPSPSETQESGSSGSQALGNTLQSRIDALRRADSNDIVHSRISVDSDDSLSRNRSDSKGTNVFDTMLTQESYASGRTRRSGLLLGSILSPKSSAIMSPSASVQSDRSFATFETEAFDSASSTELGAILTHGSSRSIDGEYAYGHYEDTMSKPTRKDNVSARSHGSVEF
ncbi:hypothetical protein PsorP6_002890 [Peronosclerospora sorghi]|uniref:Uncharacterized protein n=1 Tax=Peronosclerospora sorghi TaxID=230839 RepID=A0ACC0VM03_9STRA|nr:hypothetical protein PsorP6_002890 [Peronosclerospora sorghi]